MTSELKKWLTGNYGRRILAPLTGQDYAALMVIEAALHLGMIGDEDGEQACRSAFRAAVLAMQPSTRYLAREAIAFAKTWEARETWWASLGLDLVAPTIGAMDELRTNRAWGRE